MLSLYSAAVMTSAVGTSASALSSAAVLASDTPPVETITMKS